MPELRNRLHVALQNCLNDQPACRANLGHFVEDGFQQAVGIVAALGLPVPADDIAANLRARVLGDAHQLHPLVKKLHRARSLRGYVRGILYNASMDWLNDQDAPLPLHHDVPAGDPPPFGDPIAMLLDLIRASCEIGDRLVLFVCGAPGQYAEPLPIDPGQVLPEERAALGPQWDQYAALLGVPGPNRVATICGLFEIAPANLRQIKGRSWKATFGEAIVRGSTVPTRHLSQEMVVALVERRMHAIPACLAEGRHQQNLPAQFAAHWPWLQGALLTGTFNWTDLGITVKLARDMSAVGREQWLQAVLGLD